MATCEDRRQELTALCAEHSVTRGELDVWLNEPPQERRVPEEVLYTMLIWRSVELGELVYVGDGLFSLPEDV